MCTITQIKFSDRPFFVSKLGEYLSTIAVTSPTNVPTLRPTVTLINFDACAGKLITWPAIDVVWPGVLFYNVDFSHLSSSPSFILYKPTHITRIRIFVFLYYFISLSGLVVCYCSATLLYTRRIQLEHCVLMAAISFD